MSTKSKDNKQFMILSAIGMIMVIDNHAGDPLKIGTDLFKYGSFFMPMFVFISGYFFNPSKASDLFKYLINKAKNLLIPYYGYHLFYGLVAFTLSKVFAVQIGRELSIKTLLISPWTNGELYAFDNPMWFVPMLFIVVSGYAILRKIMGNFWNEVIASICSLLIGCLAIYISIHTGVMYSFLRQVVRAGFMLQFYQFGILYRCKLENRIKKCPPILVAFICIGINMILYCLNGAIKYSALRMTFKYIAENEKVILYLVPFVTFCTGTMIWLLVAGLLEGAIGENKIIQFISNHTFDFMANHIICMYLLNLLFWLYCKSAGTISGIEMEKLISDAWYRWEGPFEAFGVLYFIVGIAGAYGMTFLKEYLSKKIFKRKQ